MTKEDYMRLDKERLAELLAERDAEQQQPINIPTEIPNWDDYGRLKCPHGGFCTNPFHDCINCAYAFWLFGTRYTFTCTGDSTTPKNE